MREAFVPRGHIKGGVRYSTPRADALQAYSLTTSPEAPAGFLFALRHSSQRARYDCDAKNACRDNEVRLTIFSRSPYIPGRNTLLAFLPSQPVRCFCFRRRYPLNGLGPLPLSRSVSLDRYFEAFGGDALSGRHSRCARYTVLLSNGRNCARGADEKRTPCGPYWILPLRQILQTRIHSLGPPSFAKLLIIIGSCPRST